MDHTFTRAVDSDGKFLVKKESFASAQNTARSEDSIQVLGCESLDVYELIGIGWFSVGGPL